MGHFTNHKGTKGNKEAGMDVFSSLPSKVSFKTHRSFYEPQRNNRIQRGGCRLTTDHSKNQKGTREGNVAGRVCFRLYHPKCLSKPADHFTNHKGTTEDKVARMGMFFAFTNQSVFQSPPVILRITKGQKETKRPERYVFIFTI